MSKSIDGAPWSMKITCYLGHHDEVDGADLIAEPWPGVESRVVYSVLCPTCGARTDLTAQRLYPKDMAAARQRAGISW